jgi:hypothetical protein
MATDQHGIVKDFVGKWLTEMEQQLSDGGTFKELNKDVF